MPIAAQDDIKSRREAWIVFIEDSCKQNLSEISNFRHPDWEQAQNVGDFRTLVTMYTAACTAYEEHADHMFSEWMKLANGVGINANKTTEFYFMVNRRFSHLAQIRYYLDLQLKLTLISADERTKLLPELAKILSPGMSDTFFPTPASPQPETSAGPLPTAPDEPGAEPLARDSSPDRPGSKDRPLRKEVSAAFDRGVDPIRAVRAMLYKDGHLLTDAEEFADIWLGVVDLLDRDGIENGLRSQLVSLRDVLAGTIEETSPEAKTFVTNYREGTRHINEMKFLQSYKLHDPAGNMQLDALRNMLVDIEYQRANNPGSRAQDISVDTLARLYSLRDNWDDPSKLK
jgi:hypothetical protein